MLVPATLAYLEISHLRLLVATQIPVVDLPLILGKKRRNHGREKSQ